MLRAAPGKFDPWPYRGRLLASVLCAAAPTIGFLIAARALQGIAGALLVPESRHAALLGLGAMVLVFVLHGLTQHRQIGALEDELHRLELRDQTMRARFEELGALFEASHELAGSNGNRALELAAERLRCSLEADACVIYLEERPAGRLSPRAVSGEEHAPCSERAVRPGEGVAGLVHGSGRGMLVDVGPLLGQMAVEMNLERAPGTALCVPVGCALVGG